MAFGFKSYNDSGDTQIDSEFSGYRVVQSGYINEMNLNDWPYSADRLLLVSARSGGILPIWKMGSSSYGPHLIDVDYVYLERVLLSGPASGRFGMRVFNSTGSAVYDTNYPVATVAGVARHSPGQNYNAADTKTLLPPVAYGKKRYIEVSLFWRVFGSIYTGPNTGSDIMPMVTMHTDGVSVGCRLVPYYLEGGGISNLPEKILMEAVIMDV